MDLLDLILSCSICQTPLSSFSEGVDHKGTTLWMTECGHLTCATHLRDGGVPFHPETIPPEAPCPFCCIKKGDDALKALFFMRGPSRADCDPAIPREYFKIPPAKLDGTGLDSEALRFQYLSLVRFGLATREKIYLLENELKQLENHKSLLLRYISAVSLIQQELKVSRRRLFELGQDVTSVDAALNLLDDNAIENRGNGHSLPKSASLDICSPLTTKIDTAYLRSSIARASVADLEQLTFRQGASLARSNGLEEVESSKDSAAKRRKLDSGLHETSRYFIPLAETQTYHAQGRDLLSPLTLRNQSPRAVPGSPTLLNDQTLHHSPNKANSQPRQFSIDNKSLSTTLQHNSGYHSSQDDATRQFVPFKRALTTPHSSSYNYAKTPEINKINEGLYKFRFSNAMSSKGTEVSHVYEQSDNPFITTRQIQTAPQISKFPTAQESSPDATFFNPVHYSQQNPMRKQLATNVAVQNLSNPYQEDEYKDQYFRNVTPNLPTISLSNNSKDFATKKDPTNQSGHFNHSTPINLPSSNHGAARHKFVGSMIPWNGPSNSLHHSHYFDDGELDNQMPQIPAPRLAPGVGVSPARTRITLAPRSSSINCTPRPRTGISANIRTSAVTPWPRTRPRLHREQLGTAKSSCLPSMSPYFSRRQNNSKGPRSIVPHMTSPEIHKKADGFFQRSSASSRSTIPVPKPKNMNILKNSSSPHQRLRSREEPQKIPSVPRLHRRILR